MLTKKQLSELPKGTYSNFQLSAIFKNHGKQNRQVTLPVDRHGNVVSFRDKTLSEFKIMRLNKSQFARYSK